MLADIFFFQVLELSSFSLFTLISSSEKKLQQVVAKSVVISNLVNSSGYRHASEKKRI
jgi:hypothetical protein